MSPPTSNDSGNSSKLVRSRLLPNQRCLAIIVAVLFSVIATQAQEPTPTPQTASESVATTFEVIVTGSNIPTAEEVGPQPVDIYRKVDIERLGIRSATRRRISSAHRAPQVA